MAKIEITPFTDNRSSYMARAIASERASVDICKTLYDATLKALHAALSCERRDYKAIEGLLYDAMQAECRWSCAVMDLEEMEAA